MVQSTAPPRGALSDTAAKTTESSSDGTPEENHEKPRRVGRVTHRGPCECRAECRLPVSHTTSVEGDSPLHFFAFEGDCPLRKVGTFLWGQPS